MSMESDYWVVRGETMDECVKYVSKIKKDDLVKLVINNRINDFVSGYADYKNDEESANEHGKRVPYVGWYWRSTDWVGKKIPIGDCGEFIGVMENNKWDYPERYLTEEEADKVIAIVWEAKRLSEQGGMLSEIHDNTKKKLEELWDLFQTFTIEEGSEL